MYIIKLTKEERECIIGALMMFAIDKDTSKQGQKLSNQILDKICRVKEVIPVELEIGKITKHQSDFSDME